MTNITLQMFHNSLSSLNVVKSYLALAIYIDNYVFYKLSSTSPSRRLIDSMSSTSISLTFFFSNSTYKKYFRVSTMPCKLSMAINKTYKLR